jgi:tetratricopeptide (TPR) repeat protein
MMASPELSKDQRVRLALVKMYKFERDPNKRDEALRLLQDEMQDIGWVGPEAWRRVGLEIDTLIERANMNIDRYTTLPADQRKALLPEIEKTYEQAVSAMTKANMPGEDSRLLKIRGKIELLRGGIDAPIRAIQTFEKAAAQYRIETGGDREDLDLTYLLARAYYASRQIGQARQLLVRFVDKVKDFVPARVMLAELLIAEGEPSLAREHVDFLAKNAPDVPEVIKLVLQTLDVNKPEERARVKENYDKLPEETPEDAIGKAVVAQRPPVSNQDDAVRLFKKALAAKPGDFQVLDSLRRVLVTQGKKEEAIKLLEEGLATASAEDKDKIALVLTELKGGSEKDVGDAARALIVKQFANDPFGRELRLYEFESIRTGRQSAYKHLEEAEKLKGDDGRVLDLMFRHHVEQQNWEKAAQYVEKLAKINWDQAEGLVYRFRLAMSRTDQSDKQKRADARRYTDEMKQKLPEFARSWVFSAQAWQAGGDYVEAIQDYQVALDKQSNNQDALRGIIACCYQLKRYGDAGRYIDKALDQHPNDSNFRQLKRDFEMAHGDPTTIFKEAKAERDSNPKDVNGWVALGRAYLSAGMNKPGDPNSPKYLEEAKKVFRDALVQFPGERMVWANLVQLAEFQKDQAGAETILKEMAKRAEFKDSPDPMKWLADFYLRIGKADLAEATMKSAVETFKDRIDVRRELAAFYTQQKRYDEALKLLDPSSPDKAVRQQIVEIYMMAGDQGVGERKVNGFVEAEKLLRGLLQTEGKEAQLHALLGVVLLNQGKREQALESMNRALDLDGKNPTALYSRGQFYLSAKPPQIDQATRDLQNLRDVAPTHVEARVSLADAYKRKYRSADAGKELEVALRLQPGRRDVRIDLLDLYTKGRTPNWADAERLLKDVIDAEPKEVLWRRMLAKMYSARKQPEKAALAIREAIVLEPKNGDLIQDYLNILEAGKYWQQLQAECDILINGDKELSEKGWWIYVKRGTAKRYRDNKAGAMEDFMTAFKITSGTGDAQGITSMQVHVVEKMAEHLDKEQAIRRAEQLAANDPRWKVVLAYLHNINQNRTKAIALIEEVRGQLANAPDKDKMVALNVAGRIYMDNDEYDLARGAFQDMLRIKKDDVAVLNNIACLMAEFGSSPDPKGALTYSTQAYNLMLSRNVSEPNVLDTHGWVNVLCGGPNIDVGIEHLSDAVKAADLPEAHYHLGEAMLKKNLAEDATKSLARAQEILKEREEKGQPVDSKLRNRIEEALSRADAAMKSSRAAGQ